MNYGGVNLQLEIIFSKDCLFVWQWGHKQGEQQREREKQASHWARSPVWGLISGSWDHDLSQRQMLNRLSHPGALTCRLFKAHCLIPLLLAHSWKPIFPYCLRSLFIFSNSICDFYLICIYICCIDPGCGVESQLSPTWYWVIIKAWIKYFGEDAKPHWMARALKKMGGDAQTQAFLN